MNGRLRVAALQRRVGSSLDPAEFARLREKGVGLACLPEYFFIPVGARQQIETANRRQAILDLLEFHSTQLAGVVVGGSLIEKDDGRYYNACHIFDAGRHVGCYRKRHLTERERSIGLTPGNGPALFEIRGLRLAVLICADVLLQQNFQELAALRPDLIAVPTVSPYLENDTVEEKYRRDQEYFVAGARAAGAYVLKTCGVGPLMGSKLQGRSLICSPRGVLQRVPPQEESLECTLVAEIDLDELTVVQK